MSEILDIERFGVNGEGISHFNNKVVFVPFALEGEKVECEIISQSKSYQNAKIVNVLQKSSNRVEPVCPYFKTCGGCDLQHILYNKQLQIKTQTVQNNLKKYANLNCEVKDCIACSKQFNYRNHITFSVNENGKLGFFQPKTHNVLPIKKCYLANDVVNKCIDIFDTYFFDNQLYGYNYKTQKGHIKQIDLKYVNNNLLITIVGTINELPNLEHLCVRLNCLHVKYGICLSVNKKNNSVVTGGSLKYIYGLKQIENIEHDIKTYVSSFSFLQINDDIKEQIYNQISSLITGKVVLDAYSGRGVLSAIMSKKAKKVISIEISQDAVNDAIYMFATNGISNVDCLCGDFEVLVDEILEKVDTVVLDPPRKGIYQGALSKILELSPTKIIYLSCASNTLARDLKVLLQDNLYKVTLVQPYDMFPNCNDVETLVVLEKCNDKR